MGFRDSVEALLETYSKCLALLHVVGNAPHGNSTALAEASRQSELSRSLRADRAKVQKAYSSHRSETGSRLEKGDRKSSFFSHSWVLLQQLTVPGRARSALQCIVSRLADALASILGISRSSSRHRGGDDDVRPLLNYDALRALSNASCVDAIHAIDELSVRLSSGCSSAGGSSKPSKSSKSNKSNKSSRTAISHASSPSSPQTETQKAHLKRRAAPHDPRDHNYDRSPSQRESTRSSYGHGYSTLRTSKASPRPKLSRGADAHSSRRDSGRSSSANMRDRQRKHASTSSSSASTRLGEIPEKKLRRLRAPAPHPRPDNRNGDEPLEYYNVRPAYPMRRLQMPEVGDESKKKGFWGRFRRA